MGSTYRTANGKMLDFEQLRLQNEDTIAVGNMGVDAAGREIISKAAATSAKRKSAADEAAPIIRGTIPTDGVVISSSKVARDVVANNARIVQAMEAEMATAIAETTVEQLAAAAAEVPEAAPALTGLAAAIAKAEKAQGE